MTCVICKNGETQPAETTITLQGGSSTVIVENVRADVCENCGEPYVSDAAAERAMARAEAAVRNGAEVEILRFAA